jgi:Flp pilus assembly protein TadG
MHPWQDQRGMVGKLAVIWLVFLALVVVAAVDTVSIVYTHLHLANVATAAADDGAATFRLSGGNAAKACEAAQATIQADDPKIKLGTGFCRVDAAKNSVTITLHQEARTILAGRLGPTQKYALVSDRETAGESAV